MASFIDFLDLSRVLSQEILRQRNLDNHQVEIREIHDLKQAEMYSLNTGIIWYSFLRVEVSSLVRRTLDLSPSFGSLNRFLQKKVSSFSHDPTYAQTSGCWLYVA
jgi:hypothetical protein